MKLFFAVEFTDNTGQTTLEWKAERVGWSGDETRARKGHQFSEDGD